MTVRKHRIRSSSRMPPLPVPKEEGLVAALIRAILADPVQNTAIQRDVPFVTGPVAIENTAPVARTLEQVTQRPITRRQ